jgi:hypothetical protein
MPTALEKHIDESRDKPISFAAIALMMFAILSNASSSFATTKGLSQIVTPELQPEGNLSLSLQIQDKRIANPYELQAELGLTKWAEVAVFRGFQPDEGNLSLSLQIQDKRTACRLQKRSNPRLRLRFQSDVASTGRLDKRF